MKLIQQQIAEAGTIYELYWENYLAGDVDTFCFHVDDHFELIGTSEIEFVIT